MPRMTPQRTAELDLGTLSAELAALLDRAEEEARLRGRRSVSPAHVALALTVTPEAAVPLLECGVEQRDWRDYVNFILGVNEGTRRARERKLGDRLSFAERRWEGDVEWSEEVRLIVADASDVARRTGAAVAGRHVLLACLLGHGGVAGGTLRYFGVTPAQLTGALGLRSVRRTAPRAQSRRPTKANPVLLFGGGMQELPTEHVHAALRIAGRELEHFTMVGICAATGTESARQQFLKRWSSLPGCKAISAPIVDPDDAHRPSAVQQILAADIVLLDGGSDVRLHDALAGTPALEALLDACDAGAVLAGYSAGTSVLGTGCLSAWGAGEDEPVALLGWLPWVIQNHASGSFFQARLRAAMRSFPGHPGLGVPHDGAVLILPGWTDAFELARGYDNPAFLLTHPDAEPQHLQEPQTTSPS